MQCELEFRQIVWICQTTVQLVPSDFTSWVLGLWLHVSPLVQSVSSSSCPPPAWAQQSAPSLHPGDCAETCAKEYNNSNTHTWPTFPKLSLMTTSAHDNYPAAHYWTCTSWYFSQIWYKKVLTLTETRWFWFVLAWFSFFFFFTKWSMKSQYYTVYLGHDASHFLFVVCNFLDCCQQKLAEYS